MAANKKLNTVLNIYFFNYLTTCHITRRILFKNYQNLIFLKNCKCQNFKQKYINLIFRT